MATLRVRHGQGSLLLLVACALSAALGSLGAVASATSVTIEAQACADDDAKWAAYNSTCAEMKWLCSNSGYGLLVRKWCPRTCSLCRPSPSEEARDTAVDIDDAVVLIAAGRPVPVAGSSLKLSMAERRRRNLTQSLAGDDVLRPHSNTSQNGTNLSLPSFDLPTWNSRLQAPTSDSRQNGSFAEANLTDSAEPSVVKTSPTTQWKITMPFKDALVHMLSKASIVPHALWSPDQEHFVFEISNASHNASDNVSAEALERDETSRTAALQEEEDRCPAGYAQVSGHVYGGDQFGRGYNLFAKSIHECAQWCSQTAGCGSFDYSTEKKRCFRNSQTRPTSLMDRPSYVFCRRTPCPSLLTEAACLGPAVAPGWLSAEVRLTSGSYCIWSAGKCQAPMACTFEDCFLPDGGLPGMELPLSKTLWISRSGLMSTMPKSGVMSDSERFGAMSTMAF